MKVASIRIMLQKWIFLCSELYQGYAFAKFYNRKICQEEFIKEISC